MRVSGQVQQTFSYTEKEDYTNWSADGTEFYHLPHISLQSQLEGLRVVCEGHQGPYKLELVFLFCPENKTNKLFI